MTKLDGGAGTDTLSFGNMVQGSTELTLTHGGATNFENIDGIGADIIRGDTGNNYLGVLGRDTIYGGAGNDYLSGQLHGLRDSARQSLQQMISHDDNLVWSGW